MPLRAVILLWGSTCPQPLTDRLFFSILQISITAQKRSCNRATCVIHKVAGSLSRSGSEIKRNFMSTNAFGRAAGTFRTKQWNDSRKKGEHANTSDSRANGWVLQGYSPHSNTSSIIKKSTAELLTPVSRYRTESLNIWNPSIHFYFPVSYCDTERKYRSYSFKILFFVVIILSILVFYFERQRAFPLE